MAYNANMPKPLITYLLEFLISIILLTFFLVYLFKYLS
jgi:hypothetical protein